MGGLLAIEKRALAKWAAVFVWMGVILFFSTERVRVEYGAFLPNAVHFVEYAILALLVRIALPSAGAGGSNSLALDAGAFLWATAYGIIMEIVQRYVPTRSPDIKDALVNSFGALAALLAAKMVDKAKEKRD